MKTSDYPRLSKFSGKVAFTSISACGQLDLATWKTISEGEVSLVSFSHKHSKIVAEYEKSTIAKYCFGKAKCLECSQCMTEIRFAAWLWIGKKEMFLVCACGCPLWRYDAFEAYSIRDTAYRKELSVERRQRLKEAGGRHNAKDVALLRQVQGNRCIYCNLSFNTIVRPTVDHLLPVSLGGSNSAVNLVLACRNVTLAEKPFPFVRIVDC